MKHNIIKGGLHKDVRGSIHFVNDFDMELVRRVYSITHNDTTIIRAWQGHKLENKWFYCTKGAFELKFIQIDNWERPSDNLSIQHLLLDSDISQVLHLPGGYVNGFRAVKPNSQLTVFSNFTIEQSKQDDIRFDQNKWFNWK